MSMYLRAYFHSFVFTSPSLRMLTSISFFFALHPARRPRAVSLPVLVPGNLQRARLRSDGRRLQRAQYPLMLFQFLFFGFVSLFLCVCVCYYLLLVGWLFVCLFCFVLLVCLFVCLFCLCVCCCYCNSAFSVLLLFAAFPAPLNSSAPLREDVQQGVVVQGLIETTVESPQDACAVSLKLTITMYLYTHTHTHTHTHTLH